MTSAQLYKLIIRVAHSLLEEMKDQLVYSNNLQVSEFRKLAANESMCQYIFESILVNYEYEISHNQMETAIHFFLRNNTNLV